MEIEQDDILIEYERIKSLFEGINEKQLELVDGAFWECARLRSELNSINEVLKKTGPIRVNPNNPSMHKIVPAANMAVKVRANYLNYVAKLSNILGKNIIDDDDDLEEFE